MAGVSTNREAIGRGMTLARQSSGLSFFFFFLFLLCGFEFSSGQLQLQLCSGKLWGARLLPKQVWNRPLAQYPTQRSRPLQAPLVPGSDSQGAARFP